MSAETELADLEDALRNLKARIEGVGSLQIAISLALDKVIPGFDEVLLQQLNLLYRLAKHDGEDANAGVIAAITQQLQEQLSLKAND